ncbi:hypothetical protein LCGC14_2573580 [marine sediment metagenome]|uniref:XcyI family restriction endonuclease n=1 Tax=marine sediment metagenome TaxID=412755 RepID=A0A0F9B4F0_9ZZZZ
MAVAQFGLRGETFFPVPSLLRANPFLLGYYRLLYGLSQKEFYSKGPFGRFKRMEQEGYLSPRADQAVDELCHALVQTSVQLLQGIGEISLQNINELQLLTIGPQLRGSENTRIGQRATKEVYDLIRKLVAHCIIDETTTTLIIENAAGRKVLIEFGSDPDIRITETLPEHARPIISVEVKGGSDYSNIHNRLGEAEKSHQKARAMGFFEFWTILRSRVDPEAAAQESPTTSRFFNLDGIRNTRTKEHRAFRDTLSSILGIQIVKGT